MSYTRGRTPLVAGDPRLKLIFDEAMRGWSLQSSVLDELRSRAGILLSAAAVSSSFLGAAGIARHKSLTALGILAVIAFGVVVGLCTYVVWPTRNWCFSHEADGLLEAYVRKEKPLNYMYEQVALATDEYRTDNDRKLSHRFLAFRLASAALGADIVLWLIDLN